MPLQIGENKPGDLGACAPDRCRENVDPFGICEVRFDQIKVFKAGTASWNAENERWDGEEPPGEAIRYGVPFDIGVVVKPVCAAAGIRTSTEEFAEGEQSSPLYIHTDKSGLIEDGQYHVCIIPERYEITYKLASGQGLDAHTIDDYPEHGVTNDRLFRGEVMFFGEEALAPLEGWLDYWMFDLTGLCNQADPSKGRRIELSSSTHSIQKSDENHVLIEGVEVTGGVPGRTKLPVALRMRYFVPQSTAIENCRATDTIEHQVLRSCNHCDPPLAEHYTAKFNEGLRGCLGSFLGGSYKCEWVAGCSWGWHEEKPSGYEGNIWRCVSIWWTSLCGGQWELDADYWVDEDPWIHWAYLTMMGPNVPSGGEEVKCDPKGNYVFNWELFHEHGCVHVGCSGDCDDSCPPEPDGTASGNVS